MQSHHFKSWPRLVLVCLALALWAAGLFATAGPGLPAAEASSPFIDAKLDPALEAALATALPAAPLEVVIVFDDLAVAPQVEALASTYYQMQALPIAGAILTKSQIQQVAGWPEIYSITLNTPLEYFLAESVPLIGADQVWTTYGQTGGNVTVAVVDSGIDATHLDLLYGYKVVENVKVLPYGPGLEGIPNTDTSSGHGTHVASTIGGLGTVSGGYYTGVAPDVNLVGLGAGEVIAILTAVQAYDWILQHHEQYGIRVVSNSWGSTGGEINLRNPVVLATYELYQQGVLSVFAAGNDGGYDVMNPYSLPPWILSVAAGDKSGNLADFSSRGKDGDYWKHPDVTAPGVNIYAARSSTIGITVLDPNPNSVNPAWTAHYTRMSGTSMATPHVSGAAALLFSSNPQLSPDQVIDLLTANADPMPGYALHEAGYGYLDVLAAYEASRTVTGNMPAFLAGDQLYSPGGVLGFDPDSTTFQVEEHTGFTPAGVTGMDPIDYPITISDGVQYVDVRLAWTPQEEDAYDIEILDPLGQVVTTSGNAVNEPEMALFVPEMTGDYTLRIHPFAAVASEYTATVTIAYGPQAGNWPPHTDPNFDYYLGVVGVYKTYGVLGIRSEYLRGGDSGFVDFTLASGDGAAAPAQAANLQVIYSDRNGNVAYIDGDVADTGAGAYQSSFNLDNNWAGAPGPITISFAWQGSSTLRAMPTGFYLNHLGVTLATNATHYDPGDAITFNGAVAQVSTLGTGELQQKPIGGAAVTISLRDAAGNTLASTQATTGLLGAYSGALVVPAATRGQTTLVAEATYTDATILTGPQEWYGAASAGLTFPGNLAPTASLTATAETGPHEKYFIHIHAEVVDPDGLNDITSISLVLADSKGRVLKRWTQDHFTPVEDRWMLTRSYKVSGLPPWTLTLTATDSAGNQAATTVVIEVSQ
ncbi:MAG: S8 family serine peptidase [Chloroflexi bacterium]|nr:S8 family serine peptidase [Chloroflexota bacterium]MCI0579084.1 S8 family serine peptidase [Chloroflexota bacterium]MCI0644061.1 S8 family serine peptidase [Chloroflexota bacterium]MCI0727877.1 S8 family serine peptidase [Chloroflexota bacterium]